MSKRVFFLVLCTLLTVELYQVSSYFPIKAEGVTREDILAKVLGRGYDNEPSVKGVYVKYDSGVEYQFVKANTPNEALSILGYRIGDNKKITTSSPEGELLNNSIIVIQSYRTEILGKEIVMPFETISNDSLCPKLSKKIVEQEGEDGLMTQKIKRVYLEEELIQEIVVEEEVLKQPVKEIIRYKGANDTPTSVTNLGPSCDYWKSVVDSLNATEEEKQWLKFTMGKESGCNAEKNEGSYKGLFQWNPCLWYKLYPNDNIFDGRVQIKRTLQKIREGAHPKNMWPAVYKLYIAEYGKLSWLAD